MRVNFAIMVPRRVSHPAPGGARCKTHLKPHTDCWRVLKTLNRDVIMCDLLALETGVFFAQLVEQFAGVDRTRRVLVVHYFEER